VNEVLAYGSCVCTESAAMPGVNPGVPGMPYPAPPTYSTMFSNLNPRLIAETIFNSVSVIFILLFVQHRLHISMTLVCCLLWQTVTERIEIDSFTV